MALPVVGLLAGLTTAVAAVVLADRYRPHTPGVEPFLLSAREREIDRWVDLHQVTVVVLSVSSLVTAAVAVTQRFGSGGMPRRHVAAVVAAAVASSIAWYTTPLVRWDQLALWAVTAGEGIDGYWTAAFDDGVRFVVVDGDDVSQRSYAVALAIHLVAPVLAVIGLAHHLAWRVKMVRRRLT